jgi:hypothetical protein
MPIGAGSAGDGDGVLRRRCAAGARSATAVGERRETCSVFVVHGTKKFRDRVKAAAANAEDRSTTVLGDWYATVLFWKPHVALCVNESTLLPVLIPFAPAATVLDRFAVSLEAVLGAHGLSPVFIAEEIDGMDEWRLTTTSNRSVIGMINEFSFLAEAWRSPDRGDDLVMLSLRLARTPCGPLYKRHGSPDRELAALAAEHGR